VTANFSPPSDHNSQDKTITFLNQAWELRDDRSPLSRLFNFPLKVSREQSSHITHSASSLSQAIQMSLTTGLRTFHRSVCVSLHSILLLLTLVRFDECVGILSSILEISLTSRGGSLVIFSSMYQLSERTVTLIKQLELV
jgi:hypothetical protein